MKRSGFQRPKLDRQSPPPYTLTREVAAAAKQFAGPNPKDEAHRDRKLLDLAHRIVECQNCGRWVEHGCDPAHGDWPEFGKAAMRKSDDWAHAALGNQCCHAWLHNSNGMDPSGHYPPTHAGKLAMWTRAHFRTFSLYWRNGWLKCA